ncbi:hypothetical protein SLS62_000838 [Diatrype stigma]|uniref:Uncharacterized protein n=1 Tax=Diatrype stigma TaxID=117547 RepID=A0AAN9UZL5_9PEZI
MSPPSDTPESKNRVLYIQGLSPQATYHNIFEKLRDVGKIYSINMIKSSIRGFHSTSLGVVMWDWPATRRLAMQVEDGLLDRDGFKPEVKFTSGWFDMAVPRASHRSRVLVITGSAAVVRQESIVGLLRESIANLALDEVIVTSPTPDLTAMEIRFAGYRGQAELAYQKLTSDPRIARWATTEFGPDPCDLVPEDGSALD